MFDPHRCAEFFFDRLDARLRDVGPHAQNVGEVRNFDLAHRIFLVQDGDVPGYIPARRLARRFLVRRPSDPYIAAGLQLKLNMRPAF